MTRSHPRLRRCRAFLALQVVTLGCLVAGQSVPPTRPPGSAPLSRPASPAREAGAGAVRPGTSPAVAEPYLQALLAGMKAWPVGQAVRERYRVIGSVKSSGPDGVLLERASAREWKAEEVVVNGGVTRRYGPGRALALEAGLAFVSGLEAKVGQKVMADVDVVGTREISEGHLKRKVRVLKPGGEVAGR